METQNKHIGSSDGIPLKRVEAWGAPVGIGEAKPVIGRKNTVLHGSLYAGGDVSSGVIINKRCVVITGRAEGGDALMTRIGVSRHQLSALPRCQWKGHLEVDG